jgi:hypothetical protein
VVIDMNCTLAHTYVYDIDFNLTLSQQPELVFKIPIASVMRNLMLDDREQCVFLVESIGSDTDEYED